MEIYLIKKFAILIMGIVFFFFFLYGATFSMNSSLAEKRSRIGNVECFNNIKRTVLNNESGDLSSNVVFCCSARCVRFGR